jgi:hypothetical protein
MTTPASPSYAGYRFPAEIISQAHARAMLVEAPGPRRASLARCGRSSCVFMGWKAQACGNIR